MQIFMKKNFKIISTALMFVAYSTGAFASQKFYVGIDLTGQKLNFKKQNNPDIQIKNLDSFYRAYSGGGSVFTGVDFSNINLKVESFFTLLKSKSKTSETYFRKTQLNEDKSRINTMIIGLDIKPYVKFTDKTLGYLIAGVNYYKIDIREVVFSYEEGRKGVPVRKLGNQSVHKIAPSIGIGIEHFILPSLSLRSQVKYAYLNAGVNEEKSGAINKINYSLLANIGLSYNF